MTLAGKKKTSLNTAVSKRSKVIKKHQGSRLRSKRMREEFQGYVVTTVLNDAAVKRYRAASVGSDIREKRKASEEVGESGAVEYMKDVTGTSLTISRPTKTAPFNRKFDANKPWPVAVAFNGAGVADVVHWDGQTLHVVEAKGGGSAIKGSAFGRRQTFDHTTGKRLTPKEKADLDRGLAQGTLDYLTDIACNMMNSKNEDGRSEVGTKVFDAVKKNYVEYVPVSTKIPDGHTTATVSVMELDEEDT